MNKLYTLPVVKVSKEEYDKLVNPDTHTFKTTLTKRFVRHLPVAYESITGTMLVFPKKECPKTISFRPRWQFWKKPCIRRIINVVAFKEEDMSETLRFTLK